MSASIAPECNNVKEKYETCFLKWYSEKYLRGNTTDKDCTKVFEEYQKCLSKTLKERGLDGMVEEARNSSKESDAEFLKRNPWWVVRRRGWGGSELWGGKTKTNVLGGDGGHDGNTERETREDDEDDP
ncbi:uncharacterized protein PADG_12445 [Paracoccidioides brasiliensis Pb18]|uniref:Mitochondrial distribution and morphology protein 35 n=1 Tax=Paracoccidioides brasiliensis (strain Pb18) TaxID=502780 RepID=A0A0A0HS20_PARBD|nr:uncharacterized protein PADG_12445 [Paracoccidioides brasiliensis Pb18]KGM91462.1 hypothetical protein PADG_12445 [Paracoccidioides brasiliensis Pb18]